MQNSYDTNFDPPDAHFDNFCLFSDAQAEKVGNPKCYDCKDSYKTRTESRKNGIKSVEG
jgi:hypothetical protein